MLNGAISPGPVIDLVFTLGPWLVQNVVNNSCLVNTVEKIHRFAWLCTLDSGYHISFAMLYYIVSCLATVFVYIPCVITSYSYSYAPVLRRWRTSRCEFFPPHCMLCENFSSTEQKNFVIVTIQYNGSPLLRLKRNLRFNA